MIEEVRFPDSPVFTDEGRALLRRLGVLDESVPPVPADSWPQEWLDAADAFRNTSWRDSK